MLRKKQTIPDPTRLDALSQEDLSMAVETALIEATHLLSHPEGDKAKQLALLERQLDLALTATRAWRRKVT